MFNMQPVIQTIKERHKLEVDKLKKEISFLKGKLEVMSENNTMLKDKMDKVNTEVEEQLIEALKGNEGFLPEFIHTVQAAEKFESSESKEWPKAGDSVLYGPLDLIFKVIAIDGYLAWIKNDFGINAIDAIKELKKPKSPEAELCEALAEKGVQDVVILANQIINGEFDCLRYIPKEER